MPDFRIDLTALGSGISNRIWEDPASTTRASRIVGINDRQYRRLVVQQNDTLAISAYLTGESLLQPDSTVGLFTMWPIEWPTDAGQPSQSQPFGGTSALQWFLLNGVGHYTIGIRHEDTEDAPQAAAGGVVVVHVDVEAP